MTGGEVRYREPKKVVDEIEYLARLKFHQINIADDLFTAKKGHCLAVCNEIINRNLKIKWTCFSRVDTISPPILARMREAGCDAVCFGVESANAEILRLIKKKITPEQVLSAVKMCINAAITPHVSFILGLPSETPETIKETLTFSKKLKDMGAMCGFHVLAPFPGTEVREEHQRLGIKILTNDWGQYHANRAIVETPTVTREMLDQIVIEKEEEFHAWLGKIEQRRKEGTATQQEISVLRNLEHSALIYELLMNEIIERHGQWQKDLDNDPFEVLVKRVSAITGHQENKIASALDEVVKQGDLRYDQRDDAIRWYWADAI